MRFTQVWRRAPAPRPAEAAVAAVVLVVTLAPILFVPLSGGRLPAWSVPLAVLASVPLAWWRSAAVPVSLTIGAATTLLALVLAHSAAMLPAGALVALYLIAAHSPPVWRLVAVVAAVLGVGLSLLLPGVGDEATYRFLAASYVAAYALGASSRARRAQVAALAERARRLEDERAVAAARERARIARDMHDIVTHSVGVMVVQAEAGPVDVRRDPDAATAAFDAIADTGRTAIGALRRLVGTLRASGEPDEVARPGIGALPGLVDRTTRAGLAVDLRDDTGTAPVPPAVDVTAYRIVQEALTNTLRHATGARSVRVTLTRAATGLRVEITDDGHPTTPGPGGFGLLGMRERVDACGGTLHTGPAPDGGFTVVALLPAGGAP